ncbi:MAG: aldehyde dehydrogenase family protein [Candidatus Binatia bacterium]|nr:aldehyde dehydrogenase family protein [Candidatus Binatia bacterium]
MERERFYINGQWVEPSTRDRIAVIHAATEQTMATVPAGSLVDVDRAVEAAMRAFPAWAATAPQERAQLLEALAEQLAARSETIAQTITAEVGMPLKLSRAIQAGLPQVVLRSYAELARSHVWEERVGNSIVLRQPVGVVAAITPWNYPLHQAVCKVAAALAAGCTVVLKPSELAPLTAFSLAEACEAVGLPPGVLNVVTGYGPVVGEALAQHPGVDLVSFTGSTRAGKRVAELAVRSVKRLTLELGGKSPCVVLEDADLGRAVQSCVNECFLNSGQSCNALSRLLVPADRYQEAVELARAAAERFVVGDPFDDRTKLGPLVSAAQRERVRNYIRSGIAEGARLVTGGVEPPEECPRGYFVRPTVFADVTPQMTIAREEIFGPVLCVLSFKDEEDAVRLANDTIYGLAAAVWSRDAERAQRVAGRIRAGQVSVNGGRYNPLAPFGGFKQSGLGRELGKYGLEEFVELQALQL